MYALSNVFELLLISGSGNQLSSCQFCLKLTGFDDLVDIRLHICKESGQLFIVFPGVLRQSQSLHFKELFDLEPISFSLYFFLLSDSAF